MTYGDNSQRSLKKDALKTDNSHSTAKIRIVQDCAVMSAIDEFLFRKARFNETYGVLSFCHFTADNQSRYLLAGLMGLFTRQPVTDASISSCRSIIMSRF